MNEITRLPKTLVGVSGEYFVAAELSRRGYIASITLRNTRGIDILAANKDASKSVGIQVKTNNTNKKKVWLLNEKADEAYSDSHFYVFVNLSDPGSAPEFHVVPSKVVADYVRKDHKKWADTLDRHGKLHGHSAIRQFRDPEKDFLGKWELLGLDES